MLGIFIAAAALLVAFGGLLAAADAALGVLSRTDLIDLVERGLLRTEKVGRAFHFRPVPDLADRLRRPAR